MVPDPNETSAEPEESPASPEADGGTSPGFDEAALYTVVRTAVEDALLGVIGTLLLVGVAFVLVLAGVQAVVSSDSTAGAALGLAVAAFGVYLAAATLEVVPPAREWV